MAVSSPRPFRVYLPVIVPMMVYFIGSIWVALTAAKARKALQCGLDLPWDASSANELLQEFYPAAWQEVLSFREQYSDCIAEFHADVVSAYLVIFAFAMVCAVSSLPFTVFVRLSKYNSNVTEVTRVIIGVVFIIICLFGVSLAIITETGIIDFTGDIRKMLHVSNGYVGIGAYWFVTHALVLLMIIDFWFICIGIVLLVRLAKSASGPTYE